MKGCAVLAPLAVVAKGALLLEVAAPPAVGKAAPLLEALPPEVPPEVPPLYQVGLPLNQLPLRRSR